MTLREFYTPERSLVFKLVYKNKSGLYMERTLYLDLITEASLCSFREKILDNVPEQYVIWVLSQDPAGSPDFVWEGLYLTTNHLPTPMPAEDFLVNSNTERKRVYELFCELNRRLTYNRLASKLKIKRR